MWVYNSFSFLYFIYINYVLKLWDLLIVYIHVGGTLWGVFETYFLKWKFEKNLKTSLFYSGLLFRCVRMVSVSIEHVYYLAQ